jgi:membrane-bound ClpP family serine protease
VADPTVVYVVVAGTILIVGALMVRGIQIVQPGQVGFVFRSGNFVMTIRPGFAWVTPALTVLVRKVVVGSGPNAALGTVGVALADLTPDGPTGPVDLGDRQISARSTTPISSGTRVRVIQDDRPGTVLVAEDRLPYGAKTTIVDKGRPLRTEP